MNPGDSVSVKLIGIEAAKGRLRVSLKQMREDPWHEAEKNLKPGAKVKATVTGLKDFGAYVTLESGLEGMVPLARMRKGGRPVDKPGAVFQMKQEVELQVLEVNRNKQRLTLSQMPVSKSEMHQQSKPLPKRQAKKQLGGGMEGGFGQGNMGLGNLDLSKFK